MRRFLLTVLALTIVAMPSVALAGRDIIIITPKGVFLIKMVDGVPQPQVQQDLDVVIQDLVPGGDPAPPGDDPPVVPPATDPAVLQVAAISKTVLKDKDEATAVAALVDTLSKFGLTGADFKEALLLATPIADTSLQAGGRINKWAKDVMAITSDPAKLKAGIVNAWGIAAATLDTIHAAAVAGPEAAITAEALDWAKIIQIIQLVMTLLKQLGIIPA